LNQKIVENFGYVFEKFLVQKICILRIDSKWSETHKKHKTGDAEYLLVAGSRPFLYLDNVIASYHTEFHQILSIDKAVIQKGV